MTVQKLYFNIYVYIQLLFSVGNASFLSNVYPRIKVNPKLPKDAGSPLFITPYLERGATELAQNLSRVSITEKMGFRSHAGFFTIDKKFNSNMYFWYFPPFSKNENAPVMLWLQGGPGATSLYGLFVELGPLIVEKDKITVRHHHWAKNYHLIFIDNPVGTGFSFTDNDNGYCNDETCVGRGLHDCLKQFFMLFPYLQNNDFYIAGESYAGKYIPSLAMTIHQENDSSLQKINLVGMAIGNGFCDPINQMDYGNYLYQHGLIDDVQLNIFLKYQNEIATQINKQNWEQADILLDTLMDGELTSFSYFKLFTGFNYYYNFLQSKDDEDITLFTKLLQNDKIRKSVHVGNQPFDTGDRVRLHLALDLLKSAAPVISELLAHYRILFYNGQLDIVVAYPLTENFLRNLNFTSSEIYKNAKREIWVVDKEVAGYVKRAGNLTEVLVRDAGHMVPKDQPEWAFDMITRFVNDDFKFN